MKSNLYMRVWRVVSALRADRYGSNSPMANCINLKSPPAILFLSLQSSAAWETTLRSLGEAETTLHSYFRTYLN